MEASSSSTFAASPRAKAASIASTNASFTVWNERPSVRPDLDRRLAVGERLLQPAFGAAQAGAHAEVDGSILDVARLLEPLEHREDLAGLVELAALDVDLDAGLEQAQHHASGFELFSGELFRGRLRLVPATEHVQRVRALRQRRPLVRAVADLPRESDRLVEVAQRFGVPVTPEGSVREQEVAGGWRPRRSS